MILRIHPSLPAILGRGMILRRPRLPFLSVEVLAVRALLDRVVVPEEATLTQLR